MVVNRRMRWRWPWYVNGVNIALAVVVAIAIVWVRWMIIEPGWLDYMPWSSGR